MFLTKVYLLCIFSSVVSKVSKVSGKRRVTSLGVLQKRLLLWDSLKIAEV